MNDEKGIGLVELAVVILVIGTIFYGIIVMAKPLLTYGQVKSTNENMEKIIQVISAYAQTNHRIPCPADPGNPTIGGEPWGFEVGSGANGDLIAQANSCQGLGLTEGIVPFKTLGIPEDFVIDGWGNYYTYRVSPVLTDDPLDDTRDVHKRCRIDNVWVYMGESRNETKARFCCPGLDVSDQTTDLLITNAAVFPPPAANLIWLYGRDLDAGDYADADVSFMGAPSFPANTDNITFPAVILVSHGPNGFYAFTDTGARILESNVADAGADEDENGDGDVQFVDRRWQLSAGGAYFDDIVVWRTQDSLMSETGSESCIVP